MKCILPLLLLSAVLGCGSGGDLTDTTTSFSMNLVKKVNLTTDAEGGSARPEIIATGDRVFVVYLGNITVGSNRTFDVKIFDSNLDTVLLTKKLVETTADYGGPTDIRVASDGQYLYVFYETNKHISLTESITYLWGAKYKLDDNFSQVASIKTPITSSKPAVNPPDGHELLDDPAPLVGPNSVFVITRYNYSLSRAGNTTYHVREFNKDTLAQKSEFDLDLSGAADGRGRVTSLLIRNNNILMALATTVSDQGITEATDDGAFSDIILVKTGLDWTFNSLTDVQTISSEPDDRENYITGFKADSSYFYMTYKQAVGSPPAGEQMAVIKIFDANFNLVHKEKVKTTLWGPSGGEIRPSLEVIGNRIFSGQSSGQGIGTGNAEVYVYEYVYEKE